MRLRFLRPPSRARSVALVVLGPAIAIGLGLAIARTSLVGATSLCLLSVVAAAAYGSRRSGMATAVVAFLGLNFFFTEPYHTVVVTRAADLIALTVFLVVSVLVGALLARALEERERAQRRVAEAHFLDRITARLIAGERIEDALGEFAKDLVDMFELIRCEVRVADRSEPIIGRPTTGSRDGVADGDHLEAPMGAGSSFGSIVAVRAHGAPAFGPVERSFLQALAAQAALALERAALDSEVHRARLESEASQLRAALFSSVTHDLRTPLASIKASASGLLDRSASYSTEQRDEMILTVVEEADRLNRIVANLLDLARMRSGALAPTREIVWIHDLVNSVLARMRRSLDEVVVRVNLRDDLPALDADHVQLDQVLTNILENAARFSPPGREILISAAPWHDSVQIRVADQGPGIPPEAREQVFEEFYRRDSGAGRGGTGLGLAIARAIILAHGGRIWAEASPSGGAAIVFELPRATRDEASAPRPAVVHR